MEATSSPYAQIDPTIERWVETHQVTLFREWQGEARFWYISSGNECFQVAIDPPADGLVIVRATAIETDDDADLQGEWHVELSAFEQALGAATSLIDRWSRRTKTVR